MDVQNGLKYFSFMTEFKEESRILHVTSLENTMFETEENKRSF
jgi:hypothetical protein